MTAWQHSKRNFISPRGHVISSIYVKFEDLKRIEKTSLALLFLFVSCP